ncbi:hypothetical protein [Neptuniibacter sp. QD37_11]|uniref:hypothetical protein n=1 Tax=Neptuniibacter sp. QD37_11 TaxID=3398209 RepID=UPI0039F46903
MEASEAKQQYILQGSGYAVLLKAPISETKEDLALVVMDLVAILEKGGIEILDASTIPSEELEVDKLPDDHPIVVMDKMNPNTRYRFSSKTMECHFSGPKVDSIEDLVDILKEQAAMLRAPAKRIVGECRKCWGFIVEGEEHVCSDDD